MQVDGWDIPTNPQASYAQLWQGWSEFLQNGRRTRPSQTQTGRLKEMIKLGEKLRREHKHIPNDKWLRRKGFGRLVTAMREYPGAFEHLR